jgi:two-component system cell cycle response regulator
MRQATRGDGDASTDRLRLLAIVAGVWLALFAAGTLITEGNGTFGRVLVNVIYLVPHVLAIVLAMWAARHTQGAYRRLWTMLACALPLWVAGESIVSFNHVVLEREPAFPGAADAFFLAFYVALIITFLVALRPALMVRSWKAVLDGSVLALAVGFIGWVAVVEPQLSQSASLATFVGVAYPMLDVVMLTILLSLTLASFRRPPTSLLLLAAALAAGSLTDVALTYISLHTTSPELSWLKIGWEAEALLLALAAVAAVRPAEAAQRPPAKDLHDRGLAIVLAGVAITLGVVLIDSLGDTISLADAVVALYVVGAIALRLHLTSREREQIGRALEASLREQERIANTDELTGLHNRRYADRRLEQRARAVSPDAELETGVLILDLDHFKDVNDAHGHPVGDEVLRVAAARLTRARRPGDVVARYGGEEFLAILHDIEHDHLPRVAERFRECIAEEPFDIGEEHPLIVTASVGGASMPADAATLTELLRIADRALYTAKSMGRNRVQIGAHGDEGSIEGLMERGSVLNFVQALVDYVDESYGAVDHGSDAARLAGLVADELGLESGRRWLACAGARLHDIGKLAVPKVILAKPGELDMAEWEAVRRHPDVGAEILSLAPGLRDVAEVVRQHHERYDGTGYPRGLAGEEICIEARIVAVCDTWIAMRSDRPHRQSRTQTAAATELRRVAGTQLDPRVVEAFISVLSHTEEIAAGATQTEQTY